MAEMKNHWLIGLAETLLLFTGIFLLFFWKRLPPEVPWLYSQPWGETQLIPKIWFGLTLPMAVVVGLINLFVSRGTYRRDATSALVIEGATFLLAIMYLAAFFRVISIVT